MSTEPTDLEYRAARASAAFGKAVRERRLESGMTQDQLALATGIGRRFLIDLEAGKPSCQLGRSLLVAEALGLRPTDRLKRAPAPAAPPALDLPAPSDDEP